MTTTGGALPGGDGGDDGAGGDAGQPEPVQATGWLAFNNEFGVYVYDLEQFPSQDGLIQLEGQGYVQSWSRDGKWLAYLSGANWYAVDMTGDAPAEPLLLAAVTPRNGDLYPVEAFSWSADSKTAAVLGGSTLSVFDPTQAAPSLHPVTTTLLSYAWAPVGNRLLYRDASGSHVVEVDRGVPGTAIDVPATAAVWAPDANALAGSSGGTVFLTTLSGASAMTVPLTSPTAASPTVGQLWFNHDGSKLAYSGRLDREKADVVVIPLSPAPGEPEHPHAALDDEHQGLSPVWHPQRDWIVYSTYGLDIETFYARDLSDEESEPLLIGESYVPTWVWSPVAPRLFGVTQAPYEFVMFDAAAANPALTPLGTTDIYGRVQSSPASSVVSYSSAHSLYLIDAADAEPTPFEIMINGSGSADRIGNWQWSADGKFIAAVDNRSSYDEQLLIRVEGAVSSTPVRLGGRSDVSIVFRLQP
jgi:Tol biopolymer transport system component